jgi:hypothetical protein
LLPVSALLLSQHAHTHCFLMLHLESLPQVIALLSTCGSYFSKGAAGRRLDRFLTFMQAYVAAKQQLPLDVEADLQVR